MADLYDVLNVGRWATAEEVKSAYHALSRLHHPDKAPAAAAAAAAAAASFQTVNRAYKILGDPTLRAFYDKYGHAGVALAQDADADLSLVPAERRFEELERKVRSLVRASDELKLARFARVSAETQFGVKVLRVQPAFFLVRAAFTSMQQSVTFETGHACTVSLATTCHIQRGGGGVSRLSVLVGKSLNPLTSLRLAAHLMGGRGGRPELAVETVRQLDTFNSVSNTVTLETGSKRGGLGVALAWTHRFNAWLQGTLGVRAGREPGVSLALSHKQLRSKAKLEVSSSDAALSVKTKFETGATGGGVVYGVGPSVSLTQGASLELSATQTVEPLVEAMDGAFPTTLVWTLNLPVPLTSLTLSAKLSRGGLGLALPVEVAVPEDAKLECLLASLALWSALPLAGLAVKTLWRRLAQWKPRSSAEDGGVPSSGGELTLNESVRRFADERRAAEQRVRGLVICEARFEPDGPELTELLMARVANSKLVLSATPKHLLFGEAARGKQLRIKYLYGERNYEQVFGEADPVMLP